MIFLIAGIGRSSSIGSALSREERSGIRSKDSSSRRGCIPLSCCCLYYNTNWSIRSRFFWCHPIGEWIEEDCGERTDCKGELMCYSYQGKGFRIDLLKWLIRNQSHLSGNARWSSSLFHSRSSICNPSKKCIRYSGTTFNYVRFFIFVGCSNTWSSSLLTVP